MSYSGKVRIGSRYKATRDNTDYIIEVIGRSDELSSHRIRIITVVACPYQRGSPVPVGWEGTWYDSRITGLMGATNKEELKEFINAY